ncbi:hypothetical protein BpHYR1_000605 [Brachionus plicatilis]|uniref:Uncharacterized protein n=1 Tax=Brachionus plicatilis TaxID=10195 RepID=A0A3M7R6C3_BRAPC|nr:hypothetical protein BpHYR1_000605 [Brachionus plicatilis]
MHGASGFNGVFNGESERSGDVNGRPKQSGDGNGETETELRPKRGPKDFTDYNSATNPCAPFNDDL